MVEHEKTCHNREEGLVEKMTRGGDGKYYVQNVSSALREPMIAKAIWTLTWST